MVHDPYDKGGGVRSNFCELVSSCLPFLRNTKHSFFYLLLKFGFFSVVCGVLLVQTQLLGPVIFVTQ